MGGFFYLFFSKSFSTYPCLQFVGSIVLKVCPRCGGNVGQCLRFGHLFVLWWKPRPVHEVLSIVMFIVADA